MVTPLVRVKSVKKRTKRFQRHQSDRKIAVKVRKRPGLRAGKDGGKRLASNAFPTACSHDRHSGND